MDPVVVAAWIAAGASAATLAGTLISQTRSRHVQRGQLDKTLKAQSEQLDAQLKAQGKQLEDTLAEQRTRTLNERYAMASAQLGSDRPPAVRLAGVYALAGLADDWPENRQTCIDVLCAHLRMPYLPDPGDEAPEQERLGYRANREVRHTVIRVITAHLQDDAATSWQGLNLDFTGVVFDGGSFNRAKFSGGKVDLRLAEFPAGLVDFGGTEFSGAQVSFYRAKFSGGIVDFRLAEFPAGLVSFHEATFTGGEVAFSMATFPGGIVSFAESEFSGGELSFRGAKFSGGEIHFLLDQFSGTEVSFPRAEFSAGRVMFIGSTFSGGKVSFDADALGGAKFSGGTVSFRHAEFSGGEVDFGAAEFSGGTVDFRDPHDWSVRPVFPWTDAPPPGVLLPEQEDQSQG